VVDDEAASPIDYFSRYRTVNDDVGTRLDRQTAADASSHMQGAVFLNDRVREKGTVGFRGAANNQRLQNVALAVGLPHYGQRHRQHSAQRYGQAGLI
jgi:hypothetical protein